MIRLKLRNRNGRPGIVPQAILDEVDAPMAAPRTLRAVARLSQTEGYLLAACFCRRISPSSKKGERRASYRSRRHQAYSGIRRDGGSELTQ